MRCRRLLTALLLAGFWLVAGPAWADVMTDAQTHVSCADAGSCGTTHTGSGVDLAAFVCVRLYDATESERPAQSATYGGVAMTRIGSVADPGGDTGRAELWYAVGIPSGTQSVSVAWPGGTVINVTEIQIVTLRGVDQTTPIDVHNSGTGTTDPSTSVTTTVANTRVLDCGWSWIDGTLTPGAGQTVLELADYAQSDQFFLSYKDQAAAGAVTLNWSGLDAQWFQVVAAVRASANPLVVVQQTGTCFGNNLTPAICAFTTTPALGHTILVTIAMSDYSTIKGTCAGAKVIADPQFANAYNLAVEAPYQAHATASIWYRRLNNQPSGTFSVSVTCHVSGMNVFYTVRAYEVAGLADLMPHRFSGWAGGPSPDAVTVPTFGTTDQPSALALAVLSYDHVSGTTTETAGWTVGMDQEDCVANHCGNSVHRILAAIQSPTHTWTFPNGASAGASAALAIFYAADPGTGTPPQVLRGLTWVDNATNETGYRVEKRTDQSGGAWLTVVGNLPINTQSYVYTVPPGETGECFRVAAFNLNGSSYSPEACPPSAPIPPPPPMPIGLTIGGAHLIPDDELL